MSCCNGGQCHRPSVAAPAEVSAIATESGLRVGVLQQYALNPESFEQFEAHGAAVLGFDALPENTATTVRAQSINGHVAARITHAMNPLSLQLKPHCRPPHSFSLQLAYADDKNVEPVHKSVLAAMVPPIKPFMVKPRVAASLDQMALAHETALVVRASHDGEGVYDGAVEARLSESLAVKAYHVFGKAKKGRDGQRVTGMNLRYDAPLLSATAKYTTDGHAMGVSLTKALFEDASTVLGGEFFWVSKKKDYTAAVGVRQRIESNFTRPYFLSAFFQNYGWSKATFSAPLTDNMHMAARLSLDIAKRATNLEVGTTYTLNQQLLSSLGLKGAAASLHGKFDTEKGAVAGMRFNYAPGPLASVSLAANAHFPINGKKSTATPLSVSASAQLL